ncbi:GAF domain protein (macronuclear) [Tetrahymena thermophila SB210]|uniref:GAF domain protein n=1 Tax=Tetrahymena thermophila (strain SB210) TaxID=312017 RepID=Q23PX5_TETTS|nr:GAF domain protein [Tetrahymena thermophila SB210]EAR98560.2 GAF domain protein [Tetrahymena thermophila SB210]|eukprot:XP_001018805.2 GAF domain protein [Tetrahymena thermophila SB210]
MSYFGENSKNVQDEINENDSVQVENRNNSVSIESHYTSQMQFQKAKKSSVDLLNFTSSGQSFINNSTYTPQTRPLDTKPLQSNFSSFQANFERPFQTQLEYFIYQLPSIRKNYMKTDSNLSFILFELEKLLLNLSNEQQNLEKQFLKMQSQLQIATQALRQREDVIQLMREENLKMKKKVQTTLLELESTKLKHQRFTKQNNEHFYKISQQIKESVNLKQTKQQIQIEHLKNVINRNKNFQLKFNNSQLNFVQSNTESNKKIFFNTDEQTESDSKKNEKISTFNQNNISNTSETLHTNNDQLYESQNKKIFQSQFDIPEESKLQDIKKFFISADLSNLSCNKKDGSYNFAQKLQLQKAKLHSMFLFQSPTKKGKKGSQNLMTEQSLQTLTKQKSTQSLASPKVIFPNYQMKTAQKEFNQNLTINYHHTKASSLVSQFFEFKEEKVELNKSQSQNSKQRQISIQQPEATSNSIKNEFLTHNSDFHFYTLLLDMNKSEKSIQKIHNENITLRFLQKIAVTETEFRNFMMNLTPQKYSNFFQSLQHILKIEMASLEMILKLKRIILSVQKMHSSILISDAFNTIIYETCQVVNCDRASVFLIDPKRNELWTKVARHSKPIRVQIGQGLVGQVAQTGEILNVLDAHQDYRFNSDADKKNNYRTKSVLCLPIKDQNQSHIIGVLQAINKKDGDFFTKEDESLLIIISQLATAVLRNSLYHDEREAYRNNLKSLVNTGIDLSKEKSIKTLIVRSTAILIDKFDVQQARIWIYDLQQNQLIRYFVDDDQVLSILQGQAINEEVIKEEKCQLDQGIIGHIFQTCKTENFLNAYQHPLFNNSIDLNTSLPVITTIIKAQLDPIDQSVQKKIGVLQCINPKGLETLVFSQNSQGGKDIPNAFYDILEYFCQLVGDNLKNFISVEI